MSNPKHQLDYQSEQTRRDDRRSIPDGYLGNRAGPEEEVIDGKSEQMRWWQPVGWTAQLIIGLIVLSAMLAVIWRYLPWGW